MDQGYDVTPPDGRGRQQNLVVAVVLVLLIVGGGVALVLLLDDDDGSTADDAGATLNPTTRGSVEPETTEPPDMPERPDTTEAPSTTEPPDATDLPDAIVGSWEGSVTQQSSDSTYTVEMTLFPRDANGHVGSVSYPTLECGGYYTLQSVDEGSGVTLVEHITEGVANCLDGVEIVLGIVDAGSLSYRFEYVGNPEDGQGTLTRTG